MRKERKRFFRKVLGAALAAVITVTSMPMVSFAESSNDTNVKVVNDLNAQEASATDGEVNNSDGFVWWEKLDGTIGIMDYRGEDIKVTVPEEINGKKVTSLSGAFYRCSNIIEINLPDSIIEIGRNSFEDCSSLPEITIPSSVTSIGYRAFKGCSSLTEVTIPSSVTSIGDSAFKGCSSLTEVTIPSSVTSIGWSAFEGCSSLSTVEIPSSVTRIGDSAFKGCSSLTEVTIPSSVTSIEGDAFEGCSSLTEINVSEENTKYSSDSGVLFNKNKNELIRFPGGKSGEYKIPSSVTSIEKEAFKGCSSLVAVEISSGVTIIRDNTFEGCSSLSTVEIPSSVTSIGWSVFKGCSSLVAVEISSGVTTIQGNTFEGCSSLSTVEIPSSVTSIRERAFKGCSSLTTVEIPDSVIYIGSFAFSSCSSLVAVKISSGVTTIPSNTFEDCSSLNTIEIPSSVISIGENVFSGCSNLSAIKIPTSVTSIGRSAFSNCSSLTTVEIPSNVTDINYGTFSGCNSLSTVKILGNVTSIGGSAFSNCSSLTTIKMPNSVTSIGESVFSNCSSLTTVEIPGNVTNISYSTFSGCSSLTTIEIPSSVTTIDIRSNIFDGCSSLNEINVSEENTKYSSDSGVLFNKSKSTLIFCPRGKSGEYKIPSSVTSIERYALEGCNSLNGINVSEGNTEYSSDSGVLFNKNKSILIFCPKGRSGEYKIPSSVNYIEESTFSGCNSLSEIGVSEENTQYSSDSGVLFNKDKTRLIYFPNKKSGKYEVPSSVTSIERNAFYDSKCVELIEIPSSVISINVISGAFYGCNDLSEINISEENTEYSSDFGIMFNKDKTELIRFPAGKDGTYQIPDGVKSIVQSAFHNCDSLTEVTIPSSVTSIKWGAFEGCSNLTEVTIPSSVTSIEWNAFEGCSSLTIKGFKDSYAESYANNYRIPFVSIQTLSSSDDIHVYFEENQLSSDTVLTTKLLDEADESYTKINLSDKIVDIDVSLAEVLFQAYDITLLDNAGTAVQPEGSVTVKIPCPKEYNGEDCRVYRIEEDGKLTNMNAKYSENHLKFQTDHFSTYLIVEFKEEPDIIYGDINGDGNVNSKDAVLMKKYLAGYTGIDIDTEAADVNIDGNIDSKDAVRLLRYLAGYEVILGDK